MRWKISGITFKASVRGTHVTLAASTSKYLGEFTYRANHREMGNAMFDALIAALFRSLGEMEFNF